VNGGSGTKASGGSGAISDRGVVNGRGGGGDAMDELRRREIKANVRAANAATASHIFSACKDLSEAATPVLSLFSGSNEEQQAEQRDNTEQPSDMIANVRTAFEFAAGCKQLLDVSKPVVSSLFSKKTTDRQLPDDTDHTDDTQKGQSDDVQV
jgi:hypothetical protein